MKTDATKPSELVQYWKDSDKEDNEISKKVSDENICNISSDFSLTDGFFLIWLAQYRYTNQKIDVLSHI